jgi:hypothetical protein
MNNPNLPDRIKNYLNGAMSATESRQFEVDLETDLELKKAFVAYSILPRPPLSPTAQRSRELVNSVYNTLPLFPTPSLPLSFRLKMWLKPLRIKLVISAAILAALAFGLWPKSDLDIEQVIFKHSMPATCKGFAGESLSPQQLFEKASAIYCADEAESEKLKKLQLLSDEDDSFSMVDYYLAHWYLKNGHYNEAVLKFNACLEAITIIEANQETEESRDALMLNALLAQLGKDKNVGSAKVALEALKVNAKPGSEVAGKIDALIKVLAKH